MNKIVFFNLIFLFQMLSSIANSFELTVGSHRTVEGFSDNEKGTELINAGAFGLDSFISLPASTKTYILLGNSLASMTENYTYEGKANLEIWQNHFLINAELSAMHRNDVAVDELELPLNDSEPDYQLSLTKEWKNTKGCLRNNPLRYGDIENDGEIELVLMLDNDFIVFSPDAEKVIFSAHYWLDDEIDEEQAIATFTIVDQPGIPQFKAESGTHPDIGRMFPAWRSLTKIFDGELDGEEGYDLVLWRKVFDSNLNSETVGFHKVADVLVHYTKVDGEYVIVESDQSEIKSWLSENNLTWSKGYPSLSECEAEESQLIPEMHDPLLNDPEVLL